MQRWSLGRKCAFEFQGVVDSELCASCHAAAGDAAPRSVQDLAGVKQEEVLSCLNRSLTAASLAPMYLFRTSGPFTLMQRMPQAATAAATRCVLPHPGGPYSSRPVRRRSGALHHKSSCVQSLPEAQDMHSPASSGNLTHSVEISRKQSQQDDFSHRASREHGRPGLMTGDGTQVTDAEKESNCVS